MPWAAWWALTVSIDGQAATAFADRAAFDAGTRGYFYVEPARALWVKTEKSDAGIGVTWQ